MTNIEDEYDAIVKQRYLTRLTQYKPNEHTHKLISSAYQASMVVDRKLLGDEGCKYIFNCYKEQCEFEAKFFDTYHEKVETTYIGKPENYYGYTVFVSLTYRGKQIDVKVDFKPKNKTKKYLYMGESSDTLEGLIDTLVKCQMDKLTELFVASTSYVYEQLLHSNKIPQDKIDEYHRKYN
jgi:hypothetical protein